MKKGDIGGWIETEKNLSMYGNAGVSDDARVFGNERVSRYDGVYDEGRVFSFGCVSGEARGVEHAWDFADADVYDKDCGKTMSCIDIWSERPK